jgi:hypothetical protein
MYFGRLLVAFNYKTWEVSDASKSLVTYASLSSAFLAEKHTTFLGVGHEATSSRLNMRLVPLIFIHQFWDSLTKISHRCLSVLILFSLLFATVSQFKNYENIPN